MAAVEGGRVKVARGLPAGTVVLWEPQAFRRRYTRRGHDSFAGGEHDDLVVAVAVRRRPLEVAGLPRIAASCHPGRRCHDPYLRATAPLGSGLVSVDQGVVGSQRQADTRNHFRPAESVGQPSGASDAVTLIRSRTTRTTINVAIRYRPPDRRGFSENLIIVPSHFNGTAAVLPPNDPLVGSMVSHPVEVGCGISHIWQLKFRIFRRNNSVFKSMSYG